MGEGREVEAEVGNQLSLRNHSQFHMCLPGGGWR